MYRVESDVVLLADMVQTDELKYPRHFGCGCGEIRKCLVGDKVE